MSYKIENCGVSFCSFEVQIFIPIIFIVGVSMRVHQLLRIIKLAECVCFAIYHS